MARVAPVGACLKMAAFRAIMSVFLSHYCSLIFILFIAYIQPYGASMSGVSYKYTILDTSGRRSAAQVPQLPQTSYQALNTPYAFFGLGRTNNYIENLFAGAAHGRVAALEMVIPNSKLVINPGATPDEWHKELYLRPGQWIPWVGATVLGTMVALAGVVLVLHLNEKVHLFSVAVCLCLSIAYVCLGGFSSGRTRWNAGGHRIILTSMRYNTINYQPCIYGIFSFLSSRVG
jgi:hypothetical protein